MPRGSDMDFVSIVVPTYRRPESLGACLDGLRAQARPPDEVVVVVHESDDPSARYVEQRAADWSILRSAPVRRHGLVAALNRGLAAARGSIVAFVDDDAVPATDWLSRLLAIYARSDRIAAVGGRDIVFVDGASIERDERALLGRWRTAPPVGRIQWFGRMIANHHIGAGAAREVDVLKGANMSFRREAVVTHGFDERLRGHGVQMHTELSICLPLRRRGLRLVYDPAIVVRHYPAPRPHGDDRAAFDREAVHATTHNETLQVLDHFGSARRLVFAAWGLGIGTRTSPGAIALVRNRLNGDPHAWPRFLAAQAGRAAAWRTRRTPRPPIREPA
jgi:glycosyltransferase involved in cell wall biosynthesis